MINIAALIVSSNQHCALQTVENPRQQALKGTVSASSITMRGVGSSSDSVRVNVGTSSDSVQGKTCGVYTSTLQMTRVSN